MADDAKTPPPSDLDNSSTADVAADAADADQSPAPQPIEIPESAHPSLAATPAALTEQRRQSIRLMLLCVRLMFLALLVTVSLLPFVRSFGESSSQFGFADYIGPFLATLVFGLLVLMIDVYTPNKRLASVFGVYLGLMAGLVAALAMGALIDLIADSWNLAESDERQAYFDMIKLAIGLALCYLAVSIVLTTKDNFRLVIPYVEFSKQVRGVRPLVVDSSALIDGRIDMLSATGFLDAPLILPKFVLDELQRLADSGDRLKRARGRRGLTIVSKLQANPRIDVSIDPTDAPGLSVDHKLLNIAAEQNLRVLTTDYNLNKVAQIHDVDVLNINDLANTLKAQVIPGENLIIEIVKSGEERGQGIGYMPDGTMVVVEDAAAHIGRSVSLTVTNSLQTSAGRMIFGRLVEPLNGEEMVGEAEPTQTGAGEAGAPRARESMAKAALSQPRTTSHPQRRDPDSRRNPRR